MMSKRRKHSASFTPACHWLRQCQKQSTGNMPVAHATLRQRALAPDPAAAIPAVRVGFRPRQPAIYRKRIDTGRARPARRPGGGLRPGGRVARLRSL